MPHFQPYNAPRPSRQKAEEVFDEPSFELSNAAAYEHVTATTVY
jgi:hypothetical protein